MRAHLSPLPVDHRGGADVAAYQAWMNSRGAGLKEDGKWGPKTAEAARHYGEPGPVEVPPLQAWIGRAWASDPKGDGTIKTNKTVKYWAEHAKRLGLSRVALFLNSYESGDTFSAFGNETKIAAAIDAFKAQGIGVDFTAWLWPRVTYVRGMAGALGDLMDEYRDVRLELDTEMAWGSRKYSPKNRIDAADALFTWLPEERVVITDYAEIQNVTRPLMRPGVTGRPQLYSVSTTRLGPTDSDSVYWPGKTQRFGMSKTRWRAIPESCPLEIGLAAYKPFKSAPPGYKGTAGKWQIETQVRGSLWYSPRALCFWELTRMSDEQEAAIRAISGATASDGG